MGVNTAVGRKMQQADPMHSWGTRPGATSPGATSPASGVKSTGAGSKFGGVYSKYGTPQEAPVYMTAGDANAASNKNTRDDWYQPNMGVGNTGNYNGYIDDNDPTTDVTSRHGTIAPQYQAGYVPPAPVVGGTTPPPVAATPPVMNNDGKMNNWRNSGMTRDAWKAQRRGQRRGPNRIKGDTPLVSAGNTQYATPTGATSPYNPGSTNGGY